MSDAIAKFQVPPVEKSVLVPCAPARAFQAFTAEIGQWWPIHTHSVGQAKARKIILETRLGGRVFEIGADGGESDWGRILEWAPPHRFAMTWHPGRVAETHQVLELSFAAEAEAGAGSGATRVTLVHRGWEVLGTEARAKRDDYAGGWEAILSRDFAPYCGRIA
jgi:uncharacterized protein YndB with AHSA1/START domain